MSYRPPYQPAYGQIPTQIIQNQPRPQQARIQPQVFDPNQVVQYYMAPAPQYARMVQYPAQPAYPPGYAYQVYPQRYPQEQMMIVPTEQIYMKPEQQFTQPMPQQITQPPLVPVKTRTPPPPIEPKKKVGPPMIVQPPQQVRQPAPPPLKTPAPPQIDFASLPPTQSKEFHPDFTQAPGIFNITSRGNFPSIVFSSDVSLQL